MCNMNCAALRRPRTRSLVVRSNAEAAGFPARRNCDRCSSSPNVGSMAGKWTDTSIPSLLARSQSRRMRPNGTRSANSTLLRSNVIPDSRARLFQLWSLLNGPLPSASSQLRAVTRCLKSYCGTPAAYGLQGCPSMANALPSLQFIHKPSLRWPRAHVSSTSASTCARICLRATPRTTDAVQFRARARGLDCSVRASREGAAHISKVDARSPPWWSAPIRRSRAVGATPPLGRVIRRSARTTTAGRSRIRSRIAYIQSASDGGLVCTPSSGQTRTHRSPTTCNLRATLSTSPERDDSGTSRSLTRSLRQGRATGPAVSNTCGYEIQPACRGSARGTRARRKS
jgi:hypothetical protein